jgi:hypothetical protein
VTGSDLSFGKTVLSPLGLGYGGGAQAEAAAPVHMWGDGSHSGKWAGSECSGASPRIYTQ